MIDSICTLVYGKVASTKVSNLYHNFCNTSYCSKEYNLMISYVLKCEDYLWIDSNGDAFAKQLCMVSIPLAPNTILELHMYWVNLDSGRVWFENNYFNCSTIHKWFFPSDLFSVIFLLVILSLLLSTLLTIGLREILILYSGTIHHSRMTPNAQVLSCQARRFQKLNSWLSCITDLGQTPLAQRQK